MSALERATRSGIRRPTALRLPRRGRSATLSETGGGGSLERAQTERTRVLAQAHLNSLKSLQVSFERALCVRCTLVARSENLLPHTPRDADGERRAADGTLLVLAPSDVSEAEMAEHRKHERAAAEIQRRQRRDRRRVQSVNLDQPAPESGEEAAAAATAPPTSDSEGQTVPVVERRLTKQTSFSLDKPKRTSSGKKKKGGRLLKQSQEQLEQRARDARVMAALNGRQCSYSYSELYNAVWAGLADTTREQFWIVQAMPSDTSSLLSSLPPFDELVENAWMPVATLDQIRKDIFRTFPDLSHTRPFFISELYRGLIANAVWRPDIGYVQGMNALWGVIVLAISKPQQRLLVAEHITQRLLPHYFTTYSLGQRIDALVLRYYLERRRPHDYRAYCDRFGADGTLHLLTDVCVKHFGTLYSFALPRSETLRLWDMVMLRGAAALFEFALRFLHYAWKKRHLEHCESWVSATQLLGTLFAQASDEPDRAARLYETIARTELPLGRIEAADLGLRRRVATREVFEQMGEQERREAVGSPRLRRSGERPTAAAAAAAVRRGSSSSAKEPLDPKAK